MVQLNLDKTIAGLNQTQNTQNHDQRAERCIDQLIAEEIADSGVSRTYGKLRSNQRLTGNDYRRLGYAVLLAFKIMNDKASYLADAERTEEGG